ncbi:hypothetical protein [Pseudarthrobacter sp. MM222]|uniref:hypothetical protein n=1 Tax=Pseudarthrobacter sp. MM222 TaxID=3018929 RepID=UPI002220A3A5|nr:hypothetical protein [Pseudarthrobacter sp. MM222]
MEIVGLAAVVVVAWCGIHSGTRRGPGQRPARGPGQRPARRPPAPASAAVTHDAPSRAGPGRALW